MSSVSERVPRAAGQGERPYSLGEVLQDFRTNGKPKSRLRTELEKRFGNGSNPAKRQAMYLRLDRLATQDQVVLEIILSCVVESEGKENAGHWFARAATRRVAEYQTASLRAAVLNDMKGGAR